MLPSEHHWPFHIRNQIDRPFEKSIGSSWNGFVCGLQCMPLILRYGNLATYNLWKETALDAWKKIGLAESKQYAGEN